MPEKNYHPPIRLEPAAHEHLCNIVNALKKTGRVISMTHFASDLILAQPIPNGHKPNITTQDETSPEELS